MWIFSSPYLDQGLILRLIFCLFYSSWLATEKLSFLGILRCYACFWTLGWSPPGYYYVGKGHQRRNLVQYYYWLPSCNRQHWRRNWAHHHPIHGPLGGPGRTRLLGCVGQLQPHQFHFGSGWTMDFPSSTLMPQKIGHVRNRTHLKFIIGLGFLLSEFGGTFKNLAKIDYPKYKMMFEIEFDSMIKQSQRTKSKIKIDLYFTNWFRFSNLWIWREIQNSSKNWMFHVQNKIWNWVLWHDKSIPKKGGKVGQTSC